VKQNVGRMVKCREQQQAKLAVIFWNLAKTKIFGEQTAAARSSPE